MFVLLTISYFLAILISIWQPLSSYVLCTITNLYYLDQSIVRQTHVNHDGNESTIDLVFVSEPSLLNSNSCDTIPPLSNSNHMGVLIKLFQKSSKAEKSQGRLIWRYAHADWDKACELINQFNWDSVLSSNNELSWKQRRKHAFLINNGPVDT